MLSFFLTDPAPPEIYPLSLHDALPISGAIFDLSSNDLRPEGWTSADAAGLPIFPGLVRYEEVVDNGVIPHALRSEEHTSELQSRRDLVCRLLLEKKKNRNKRLQSAMHT